MRKAAAVCVGFLSVIVPAAAHAQTRTTGGFVSVNGLGQAGGDEVIAQSQGLTVYGESGTTSASQQVELAAGLLDIGAGFRMEDFGVGLAFTSSKNTNTAAITGSIPHPFLFDRRRNLSSSLDELEHKEQVVHLQAWYFVPVAEKVEIGLFLGPSFYRVTQDYVTGLGQFTESSSFDTVSLPVSRATAKKSQVGYNIGADATYAITPNVGVGALLRFTRASPELDLGSTTMTMNVGDIQVGGGIRFRF